MALSEELLYTENHEWILVEGGEAVVGISKHAQAELGDVVFVELPEVGMDFNQGDDFAVVESVKAVSDIYMPISGRVIANNQSLIDQPELINNDPYEGGWIIRIEIADEGELDDLMDSGEYTAYLEGI